MLKIGPYPVTRGEISGAFADLGVLVPLEAALIGINGLNPTTTLLGVGITYIAAGWYFRIPMPVQPLKAFSVLAIASALEPEIISAGALLIGVIMGLLALTGAVELLHRLTPLPVVRGIQFGLGLILLRGGLDLIAARPFLMNGTQVRVELGGGVLPLGPFLGLAGLVLLVVLLRRPVVPASVALLAAGIAVGLLLAPPLEGSELRLGPAAWSLRLPAAEHFGTALFLLVIPQLPLSLANAVISTADVARTYFGEGAGRVTPRQVALSYGLVNLWAGLAGGLPSCHGAGGLTAHYRLGARTPAAGYLIGGTLVVLALAFGQSATAVRSLVPSAIFGVLLLYVGWEHLRLGLQLPERADLAHVALVGIVSQVSGGNLAVGALAGLGSCWVGQRVRGRLRRATEKTKP